jgi:hypothetical protein
LQRELIEEVGDGYRFQIELIRQWVESKKWKSSWAGSGGEKQLTDNW